MGLKSTVDIDRHIALKLIIDRQDISRFYNMTNQELSDELEKLGYGENRELPYYGQNFNVTGEKVL